MRSDPVVAIGEECYHLKVKRAYDVFVDVYVHVHVYVDAYDLLLLHYHDMRLHLAIHFAGTESLGNRLRHDIRCRV